MDSGHNIELVNGSSERWSRAAEPPAQEARAWETQTRPPVFVHSAFRCSSTWMWARMRAAKGTMAFYECFHESLDVLEPSEILSLGPDSWRSRHPTSSAYFIEFLPLLRETGGVENFDRAYSLPSFIPRGGPEGALSEGEKLYVDGLIRIAEQSGRAPVLTCTRSIGRIGALKAAVGGTHICLRRKLLHQWHSFSGQRRTGNPYFIDALFETISLNRHDPYLGFLQHLIDAMTDGEARPAGEQLEPDDVFVIFVGFHVYVHVLAARHADLIIDVAQLHDDGYRAAVTRRIHDLTAIDVDLADVDEQVDYPEHPLVDLDRVRKEINALVVRALSDLQADPAETALARALIDELWTDHRLFSVYTSALEELAREDKDVLAERMRIGENGRRQTAARADAALAALAAQALHREQSERTHAIECAELTLKIAEAETLAAQRAEQLAEQTPRLAAQAQQLAEQARLRTDRADELEEQLAEQTLLRTAQAEELAEQAQRLTAQAEQLVEAERRRIAQAHRIADQARLLDKRELTVKSLDETVAALRGDLERAQAGLAVQTAEAVGLGQQLAGARTDLAQETAERQALLARLTQAQETEAAALAARQALEQRVEALTAETALWTQRFSLYDRSRVFRALRGVHRVYFLASQRLARLVRRGG